MDWKVRKEEMQEKRDEQDGGKKESVNALRFGLMSDTVQDSMQGRS